MYLLDLDRATLKWKGQNSWGKDSKYLHPRISIHAPGTKIYDVVVTSMRRLEATAGDKGENVGSWPLADVDAEYEKNPLTIPTSEYHALLDLYNQCGGHAWAKKQGWKTEANTWQGVMVEGGRVVMLILDRNNLTGGEPPTAHGTRYS